MSDTWASGAERFNKVHAPAGSPAGGQFAAASGSSGGKGKDTRPTPTNQHPVGQGETGKRVSDLQERLNAGGFKPPLKVDGIFGPKTLAAVKAFQRSHGLKVDGMVGPKTTAALRGGHPSAQHHAAHPATHTPAGTAPAKAAQRASDLKYGHGSALWNYWTSGEGFAKWSGAVHKWTTLRDLLLKAGVPAVSADGLTTNIIQAVMPGYMKQAHADHKAGRSAVTEPPGGGYDADGLDSSWDGDCSDLPDLTGLDVADLEAAEGVPPDTASRAMPKLGTGARFARLKSSLAAKGARDPGALAAYIGRKKFGKGKFAKIAAKARGKGGASRMSEDRSPRMELFRSYPLEDYHIVRAGEGDSSGRVVEAYMTVFDEPAEIRDHQGWYEEDIDRAAFNKRIADLERSRNGFAAAKVFYNHGMTIHGTPSDRYSMPTAVCEGIRTDTRGPITRSRYLDTPLGNEVLEMWRSGAVTAQSFTGAIIRSSPELRRGQKYEPRNGQLPRVRRLELGLKEYGPTPFPAYAGAELVGVRMSPLGTFQAADDDEYEEALPPDEEAAAGEPLTRADDGDGDEHSARYHQHRLFVLTSQEARERVGLVW